MDTLRPAEPYPITRVLENPFDTDTHFMRAVIRNASTRQVIDSIDLVDRGDRYFSEDWTPPDTEAGHYYVVITTSVFDDAGYTVQSQNYADLSWTMLVDNTPYLRMGGGGGSSTNYETIRRIVKEELERRKMQKFPKIEVPEAADLTPVLAAVKGVERLIVQVTALVSHIKLPPAQKLDLGPIKATLETLEKKIGNIRIPNMDFSPTIRRINDLESMVRRSRPTPETLRPIIAKALGSFGAEMEGGQPTRKTVENMPYRTPVRSRSLFGKSR